MAWPVLKIYLASNLAWFEILVWPQKVYIEILLIFLMLKDNHMEKFYVTSDNKARQGKWGQALPSQVLEYALCEQLNSDRFPSSSYSKT